MTSQGTREAAASRGSWTGTGTLADSGRGGIATGGIWAGGIGAGDIGRGAIGGPGTAGGGTSD